VGGNFTWGRYRFEVESSDWESDQARGIGEDFQDDAFDLRLTGTGTIPDLGGAPIASWLLARLARLTDGCLGLADREDADGGGYVVEFVVYRVYAPTYRKSASVQRLLFDVAKPGVYVESEKPDKPVASFQFQADMEGAAVVGRRAADCPAEDVLEALAAALLAATTELMGRELEVRDPEWKPDPEMYRPRPVKGSCNWYGWDGFQFLGQDNIRDAEF
jgi:hypothetical protein